ncbi:MAG: hypothetical protein HY754_15925 [Nitrospirae bacterium]|nr:hypothetical protein [Nitrospirota bacterium]
MKKSSKFKVQSSKSKNHLLFVIFLLFTVHCSLLYAESLSDIKINALQLPVKTIEEKWGKDPFIRQEEPVKKERPITLKKELPLDLKVAGIISDGKKALAIINGGFYRKRERVKDFLIVDIAKDTIVLEKNGKRFSLGIEKFAIEGNR